MLKHNKTICHNLAYIIMIMIASIENFSSSSSLSSSFLFFFLDKKSKTTTEIGF